MPACRPEREEQFLFTGGPKVKVYFDKGYDGSKDQILNLNDKYLFTWELIQRFLNLFKRPVSISYQVTLLSCVLRKLYFQCVLYRTHFLYIPQVVQLSPCVFYIPGTLPRFLCIRVSNGTGTIPIA